MIEAECPDHGIFDEEYVFRADRCGIRLGPRSDRRHEILRDRDAGLRHADRAAAPRTADPRYYRPTRHPRMLDRCGWASDDAERTAGGGGGATRPCGGVAGH